MFYSQFILAKKGPLGRVWLASHWPKRLTKSHVFEADIVEYVDNIINPQAPLALRLSGHLMLGVIRIYSRKTKYFVSDCNDALVKLKMACKSNAVDLDRGATQAAPTAITLGDDLNDFAESFGDNLDDSYMNTSRIEDITLADDQFSASFTVDQAHFGGFDEAEDDMTVPTMEDGRLDLSSIDASVEVARNAPAQMQDQSFGALNLTDMPGNASKADGTPNSKGNQSRVSFAEDVGRPGGLSDEDDDGFGDQPDMDDDDDAFGVPMDDGGEVPGVDITMPDDLEVVAGQDAAVVPSEKGSVQFVLQPIEETAIRRTNAKKRRLVIDRDVCILEPEMKQLLTNTTKLVRTEFKRPKRICRQETLMVRRKNAVVERVFDMPGMTMLDDAFHPLFKIYLNTAVVKRCRTLHRDTESAALDKDAAVDDTEVARHAAQSGVAQDARPDDDDEIELPVDDFDDDFDPGESMVAFEEDGKGLNKDNDDETKDKEIPADDTFDDGVPDVALDFDDDHGIDDLPTQQSAVVDSGDDDDETTNDQYQSRGWSKRTVKVLKRLDRKFTSAADQEAVATVELSFRKIAQGQTRLSVANLFYECLMLKTRDCIGAEQNEGLADIALVKAPAFDSQLAAITASVAAM